MPYIDKMSHECLDDYLNSLIDILDSENFLAGELNYVFSKIIHASLECNMSYTSINEVIGVLECCKLELYHQIAAPYEREKHKLNGPVSELDKNGE